jgi:hypothetical protein
MNRFKENGKNRGNKTEPGKTVSHPCRNRDTPELEINAFARNPGIEIGCPPP